ncbi:two-partner secretion domain-containing protein [Candidatus Contendibacter odensensis]|uniref:two-partner secretion domain-containing protein n=1 Tax=Candidatus Contendibacter odensensis TaxID=1400860 RepID=UPI00227ED5E4|nr:filamentous hemagglutinin N-terminal domain-containing protein [Candidatus Contendobacter odensis]
MGRVTGGQSSFIDGTIRSTIPGANLYLLNPAGVLFGEHATLDVPGSVHVSTADDVRLSDGGRFDARSPANSVLTVAPVAAFGFLGDMPGKITATGSFLQVPEGQTLSLIGGDISLSNATLYAPAGRINLAAVGSAGEVLPTDTDLAMPGFSRLGAISVERTATERRKVGEAELGDIDASGQSGGAIFIRGGQFVAQGRSLTQANTTGDQDGRGISIAVDRLALSGGSRIQSNTSGTGRGGDINVTATEEVTIDGAYFDAGEESLRPSGLTTDALSDSSQAGNITLSTTRLSLTGGGAITSVGRTDNGDSRAGNLNITATESIAIDAINPDYVGNVDITGLSTAAPYYAGDITIKTARLSLMGGGAISSFTWGNSDAIVRGGDINITATEFITIDGPNSNLLADNYGPITSPGAGSGNAGNITLNTARLSLTGGGVITSTSYGVGRGGNLNVTTTDSVIIAGYGDDPKTGYHFISGLNTAGYEQSSDAGTITLTTGNLLIDGGDIVASSLLASGGNITVNADHLKLINGAEISSSVFGNELSKGGNVTLNSTNIIALNGGSITAKAQQGKGGNILVNADVFLHDAANVGDILNASSQVIGNDGTVRNNAPTTDLSGSLTVLPANYLDAATPLSRRCGEGDPDARSRFTVQGRGVLPPAPDEALPAPAGKCQPAPAAPPAAAKALEALHTAASDPLLARFGGR